MLGCSVEECVAAHQKSACVPLCLLHRWLLLCAANEEVLLFFLLMEENVAVPPLDVFAEHHLHFMLLCYLVKYIQIIVIPHHLIAQQNTLLFFLSFFL